MNSRFIFRWIHIICGIPILGYIYDSPSDTHNYAHSVRYFFLPVLLLSGLWMWKGHIVRASDSETIDLTEGNGASKGTEKVIAAQKRC